jgi:hypothetical protein
MTWKWSCERPGRTGVAARGTWSARLYPGQRSRQQPLPTPVTTIWKLSLHPAPEAPAGHGSHLVAARPRHSVPGGCDTVDF